MASNKTGINNPGGKSSASLGGVLIKILAAGVAGGALLISGAKAFGEALLDAEANSQKKLDEQRALDREEVRRITSNEVE